MLKAIEFFMREIHWSIGETAKMSVWALKKASYDDDRYGTIREELAVFRRIGFNQAQSNALEKLMIEFGRSVVFNLLCMIDGVDGKFVGEELPVLALIDRATGQEITDNFLHDEFYEFAPYA